MEHNTITIGDPRGLPLDVDALFHTRLHRNSRTKAFVAGNGRRSSYIRFINSISALVYNVRGIT